jgi:hypothetical protein
MSIIRVGLNSISIPLEQISFAQRLHRSFHMRLCVLCAPCGSALFQFQKASSHVTGLLFKAAPSNVRVDRSAPNGSIACF